MKLNEIQIKENKIKDPIIIINQAKDKDKSFEKEIKNSFIKNKNRINKINDSKHSNEIKKENIQKIPSMMEIIQDLV